jgi:hypothetical protein
MCEPMNRARRQAFMCVLINTRGLLPIAHMANEPMRLHSTKSKGLPIDVSFYSYIFYMCSATYKKQGVPDQCPILLLDFLHVQRHVQKARGL